MNLFDYTVFTGDLNYIRDSKLRIVNTINPHSYAVAKGDPDFRRALINCDILLPDGVGIVFAARVLFGKKISKIAGADLHKFLLENAQKEGQKIFYLGSSPDTLDLIKKRIHSEYSNVKVETYSPPFKAQFTFEDDVQMLQRINDFEPDILFVGMTAPKQEKWVFHNHERIKAGKIAAIGAVFDFYAGTVKRSGQFWIDNGLEWLPRLLKEPKRLWRRNFISTPIFVKDILLFKINKK